MKETILAQRYAKALFSVALERDLIEKIRGELYLFVTTLEENKKLVNFILSPENSYPEKRKVIKSIFEGRCSREFFNFLLLLLEKGRNTLYSEIYKAFNALYDKHHRKQSALAISAVALKRSDLAALETEFSKSLKMNFEIENHVEPEILGGLILNIDGKILDGSVRMQLERLQQVVSSQLN